MMYSVGVALLALAGLTSSLGYDCLPGWFGSNCQYKCRCLANKCAAVDGRCTNGTRCQLGWFGPGCQYVDLAQSETVTTRGYRPLAVVSDSNEETCLGSSTREVAVKWSVPYQVTWIRVHVKGSYLLSRFSVKFRTDWNRLIQPNNMRTSKVSETALDIHCDLNVTVTQVVVTWDGETYLCSLYISGGRNVALKQATTQSSTFPRSFKLPMSSYAVDGDSSSDYVYGTCAQTGKWDANPKWSVEFSRNFTVNRYRLFHRIDANDFLRRTYWFVLQGLTQNGTVVFTDRGSGWTIQNVYGITTATSTAPIGQVSIQSVGNSRRFTAAPSTLSLCEVEVYGESICDNGWFGPDCEHKCNCLVSSEVCFVSTGGCISGCASGYLGEGCLETCPPGSFGLNCQSTCSQLCLADRDNVYLCDHIHGTCLLGCQIGFEGPWCNSTCTQGTYGQGCSYECSELCASGGNSSTASCHHLHGVCLHGCRPGYTGLMCNEACGAGRYGQRCNSTCSPFCLGDNNNISICDHATGRCLLGCRPGYDGLWCNRTCSAESYGTVCQSSCSQHCQPDNTSRPACHHVTGSCLLGCQSGYKGRTCDEPCTPGSYGPDCGATCSELCAVDSVGANSCHHINGVCLRGCQKGFEGTFCDKSCDGGSHGDGCNTPCSQFCGTTNFEKPVCHNVYGICLQGCQRGYRGPFCNQTCDSGYFGHNCSYLCPQFCEVVVASQPACHHVNGTCLKGCQAGFTGRLCEYACPRGTYGPRCSLVCSQFCSQGNRSCDPVDGTCLYGCISGFTDPRCNKECPPGKFGLACKFDCSQNCQRSASTCSHVNGSCLLGCLDGFEGHNCTSAMRSGDPSYDTDVVWVAVVVCCGVVLAAVGVTFWRRRKQIKSRLMNIAIQVMIHKSSSTANIVTTDVSEFSSQSFST